MKMRWIQQPVLALGLLWLAPGLTYAADPEKTVTCSNSQVTGSFTATTAKYSFSGACLLSFSGGVAIPWSAQGYYDEKTVNGQFGRVREEIVVSGPSPFRGKFSLAMVCNSLHGKAMPFDPWLREDGCGEPQIQATGEMTNTMTSETSATIFVKFFVNRAQSRRRPVTASFSYNRPALLAKRQTELQAVVAKAEKEKRVAEQKQQATTQPPSTYREAQSPIVLSPLPGQQFFKQAVVPIKLNPPGGLTIGGYMVKIERKGSAGNWLAQTTLPVGAAQATSATGYMGFGAGIPPCCLTDTGAYRLSAQVSYPKPSGWSDWIEFGVIEPPPSNFNQLKPRTRTFPK